MANLQDIRRRIRSVKSIQQITNAMDMVAMLMRAMPETSASATRRATITLAAWPS